MLQGDAIREITLEGPGAGGIETASAVVADMVASSGRPGTGFLQNDPAGGRSSGCRPASCARRSTSASRSRTAPACSRASPSGSPSTRSRSRGSSSTRSTARRGLHVVTHEARGADRRRARGDRRACRRLRGTDGAARGLRPRRRGARLGVMPALRRALPRPAARQRPTRRSCRSARARRRSSGAAPLGASSGSSCGSSREARTRPGCYKDRGMTVAVSKALEDGAEGGDLRLDRQHGRLRGRVRGPRGLARGRARARGRRRRPRSSPRRAAAGAVVLEVRGSFDEALAAARELAEPRRVRARQLAQPVPARGPEDRGVRDRRGARRAPDVFALPYGGGGNTCAYARGFDERGGLPRLIAGEAADRSDDRRDRDPDRRARARRRGDRGRSPAAAAPS